MAEQTLEEIEYKTLSVIVPVYNERTTVAEIIRRVRTVEVPLIVYVATFEGSRD